MKNILLYHKDLDGRGAATVVSEALTIEKYIPINYGYDWNEIWNEIKDSERVIIVDFSLKDEEMDKILSEGKDIIWIDHHISASESKYWDDDNIKGLRDVSESGAMLTWKYFFNEEVPKFILYVDDYDLWKFELGVETHWLNEYLYNKEYIDNKFFYHNLISNDGYLMDIMNQGKILFDRRIDESKKIAEGGREIEMGGRKFFGVNSSCNVNLIADEVRNNYGYNDVVVYKFFKDRVIFSLRGVNVDEVAKKFGGGGHKAAAGFSVEFERFNEVVKFI